MPQRKPTIAYVLIADKAIQDAVSAKWSLVDIFEVITIPPELDSVVVTFSLFGKLLKVPAGPAAVLVEIVDPEGDITSSVTMDGTLSEGELNISVSFDFIKFEKIGRYHIRLSYNGQKLADNNRFSFSTIKTETTRP